MIGEINHQRRSLNDISLLRGSLIALSLFPRVVFSGLLFFGSFLLEEQKK